MVTHMSHTTPQPQVTARCDAEILASLMRSEATFAAWLEANPDYQDTPEERALLEGDSTVAIIQRCLESTRRLMRRVARQELEARRQQRGDDDSSEAVHLDPTLTNPAEAVH